MNVILVDVMLTAWKLLGAIPGAVFTESIKHCFYSYICTLYMYIPVWLVVKVITFVLVFPAELLACIM